MTHSRRQLLELLDGASITLGRALGQNYVADPNTVRRIARLAGVGPGDRVVEIGAGVGSLTLALAETGARIVAVELDRAVVEVLRRVVAGLDVEVVEADATTLSWADHLDPDASWALVANLPYNIAVPLVLDVLEGVPAVRSMTVMIQREVAERLAADPGGRTYGIPTVKLRWWGEATVVGRVPPTVFVPQPRVESALLRIERRPPPAPEAERQAVFNLVDTAFGQRRKMLRRSLAGVVPADSEVWATAGVDPESRPERLDVAAWLALARALAGAGSPPR